MLLACSRVETAGWKQTDGPLRSVPVHGDCSPADSVNMAHWSTFEKESERDTKRLIRCLSGIEDEEDQNFQLALKFAWSNFK